MKSKITTLINKYIFVFALVAFFSSTKTFGQTVSAPTHGLPSNPVTQYCANEGSVPYNSTFTITGIVPANQFRLELSDANGVFSATPPVLSSTTTFVGLTGTFSNFFIPVGTSGTGYRLRVVCTSPAITSVGNAGIPAYHMPFNSGFSLNGDINPLNICGSGNFLLFIDNGPLSNDSPVDSPSLKYRWKKDGIFVPGEINSSLNISTSGVYQAFVDYGSCSTFDSGQIAKSSAITVNIVASGATFTIASSGGNVICPPATSTLSVTAGYAYQWSRDGVAIPGATANSYVTGQAGSYTVVVNQGGCSSTSAPFVLSTTGFNSSISSSFNVLEEPLANILAAGDLPKIFTVTTDAASPTYEWYLNGTLIPAETTNSYSASIMGHYKVKINQTSGCNTSKEHLFELKEGINPKQVPNLISPNGDGINDTWIIPQEYATANTEVLIISPQGAVDFQTVNYQNNWPIKEIVFKSTNPVYYYIISKDGSPVKKGSITIIK